MRLSTFPMFAVLVCVAYSRNSEAQQRLDLETEIHRNVRLIEIAATPDIPAEIAKQYQNFLPIFKDILKRNTKDQTAENGLTVRITVGVKEVGSAKTKRPQARIAAFCRNSVREYLGNFTLHSYLTNSLVGGEETDEFLRRQILDNLECYAPTARIVFPPKPAIEPPPPAPEPSALARTDIAPPRVEERSPAIAEKPSPLETIIHRNVKLIETPAASGIPPEIVGQFKGFLPIFKEALRENTKDQPDDRSLIMRISVGMREVGPAKIKRPQAHITALAGDSSQEFVSDFSLYSYDTNDNVNREETNRYLIKQILQPLECYAPPANAAAATAPRPAIAAPAVEMRAALPPKPDPPPPSEPRTTENASASAERTDNEIEISRNVRLIEIAVTPDIPSDLAAQYQKFLPIFREVLKEKTQNWTGEETLVVRVALAVKEIGAAKTKRAQARITAFIRNSRKEYIGQLLLYSYETNGPVNKEETRQFLKKQILEPLNI
jgi:hypothetical protein